MHRESGPICYVSLVRSLERRGRGERSLETGTETIPPVSPTSCQPRGSILSSLVNALAGAIGAGFCVVFTETKGDGGIGIVWRAWVLGTRNPVPYVTRQHHSCLKMYICTCWWGMDCSSVIYRKPLLPSQRDTNLASEKQTPHDVGVRIYRYCKPLLKQVAFVLYVQSLQDRPNTHRKWVLSG